MACSDVVFFPFLNPSAPILSRWFFELFND